MSETQYKIQVASNDVINTSAERVQLIWADLEGADGFTSMEAAHTWLAAHDGEQLQRGGLNFRVMPSDYPCKFVAALERAGV